MSSFKIGGLIYVANKMHYYKTLGKRSTSPHYHYYIFIHFIIIGLNAQTKLQYDAMVYLCLSNVLLIFEHDQSHVMIGRFNIHIKHKKITFLLFYYLLQIGYYNGGCSRVLRV
jgi:hypothetical protein